MKHRSGWIVMGRLIGLVKPLSGYMALAILMGLVGHLCASLITIFGAYAVLNQLGFESAPTIPKLFVGLAIFAVMRAALRYGEQSCNHFIAFKLLALIRDCVFRALRRLAPAKLDGRDKGDLISVITADIELLEVFYAHTISPAAIWLLFTICMSAFIGAYHRVLGAVAFGAYLTVGAVIPLLISKRSGKDGANFRAKAGALSGFVLDSLRGLSEIIQYGQGALRLAQMNLRSDELAKDEERMKRNSGINTAVTQSVILFFDLAMLIISAYLYGGGKVDFAGVLIPTVALFSSFGPSVALANLGSTLQNTFAAGNRVLDILEEKPIINEVHGKSESAFSGAKADQVHFIYDREDILKNVSVEIEKNAIIGITGRSGSGKSTLLKLFMRFYDAQAGRITISDRPIAEINTDNLRGMESFVTQQTHLFHDSIRNNLRISKLDASETEIEAACRMASVHEFIMTLPQGYDTPVGELGDTLSGGERQRLGLARAFLHDAPFLLLDEPTSNLDSLNEAIILKSLLEARNGKTVALVSHRASTMRIADRVVSVEHGRIS